MTATAPTRMNHLSPDRLRALGQTFFATRGENGALEIEESVEALVATIWVYRNQFAATLRALPEASFAARSVAPGAEEQWSAGQVIDHVCGAQRTVMFRFVDLISTPDGTELPRPELPPEPRPLSRAESLAELEQANAALDDLIARLSAVSEPTRTTDSQSFGKLGIRGILLFFAIHEYDHLGQLRT